MAKCSHHQYFYHASASGLSAEIERPVQQSIAAQAASTLPSGGGRGFQRTEKFCVAPFVCFDAAYSEVGGSFDECHMMQPNNGKAGDRKKKAASLLPWGDQDEQGLNDLLEYEKTYHALNGIGSRAKAWSSRNVAKPTSAAQPTQKSTNHGGAYWCSAAGHLDLKQSIGDTELQNFGSLILIPKFGVVRLAELVIHPDYQRLTMVRVQMCSGSTGTTDGGSTGTSGGRPVP
jgi:hypothetical protein